MKKLIALLMIVTATALAGTEHIYRWAPDDSKLGGFFREIAIHPISAAFNRIVFYDSDGNIIQQVQYYDADSKPSADATDVQSQASSAIIGRILREAKEVKQIPVTDLEKVLNKFGNKFYDVRPVLHLVSDAGQRPDSSSNVNRNIIRVPQPAPTPRP